MLDICHLKTRDRYLPKFPYLLSLLCHQFPIFIITSIIFFSYSLLPTSYFLLTKFAYARCVASPLGKRYPLGQRGAKCGLSVNPRNARTSRTKALAACMTTSRYSLLPTPYSLLFLLFKHLSSCNTFQCG